MGREREERGERREERGEKREERREERGERRGVGENLNERERSVELT